MFSSDLRLALRSLLTRPGFTLVAVGTLALGIGANTAIFSVVNAVLLRPLPYEEPDRLVTINHFYPSLNLDASVSVPGFRDYRDRTRSFQGVAVETGWNPNLTGTGEPERLTGARVSGLFFSALGVSPAAGRALLSDDDSPGRNLVVVLSHGFSRRHFGGRAAVGQTLMLDGERYEVVGVMPPSFRDFFNRNVELWTPIAFAPDQFADTRRTNEFLALTARLKPDVTIESAAAEMKAFAEQLKKEYPANYPPDWSLKVDSLNNRATRTIRSALLVLLGAVGIVLLIACANLANLLLARAASQLKEIAVRSALGASRLDLIRQLLTESLVTALAGGTLGLLLAYWGARALVTVNSAGLPWAGDVTIDGTVFVFTVTVSLATGLLFGLAPALRLSGANMAETLREGGRGTGADRTSHLVRRILVVAEVGLALVLLAGAGLLIRSFARLQTVDPGFRAQNILTANIALPATKYPTAVTQVAFFDQLFERLAVVPGVSAVGATTVLPFSGGWSTGSFRIEGFDPPPGTPNPWGDIRIGSAGFAAAKSAALR